MYAFSSIVAIKFYSRSKRQIIVHSFYLKFIQTTVVQRPVIERSGRNNRHSTNRQRNHKIAFCNRNRRNIVNNRYRHRASADVSALVFCRISHCPSTNRSDVWPITSTKFPRWNDAFYTRTIVRRRSLWQRNITLTHWQIGTYRNARRANNYGCFFVIYLDNLCLFKHI